MRKLATLVAFLMSSSAFAATPPEGVPLQVRRGFFTETSIGGLFTVGGVNDPPEFPGYSNFQIYLQLGLGYQFTLAKGLLPIGLHVGIGSNAQNCFATVAANRTCTQADNFSMVFLNASAGYLHQVVERFYVGGKLIGGATLLDPDPVGDGGLVRGTFGVAATVEYATNMDHFSIGLDLSYRLIVGPNISALMPYFRVQYTF